MRRASSQRPEEQRIHVLLRGVFALFFFLYFYKSQDAAISLAQHQLSLGQTSFQPFTGAVILTALLIGLQALVLRVFRLSERFYVLSFLPSAVCAVLLTAFVPYYRPSALLLTVGVMVLVGVFVCHKSQRKDRRLPVMTYLWQGLLLMAYMGFAGNANDVLTYEVRVARCLNAGDFSGAMEVGDRSLATSPKLVAMRAYAMSHFKGGLGAHLFSIPLSPDGSRQLCLEPADTSRILFRPDSLYRHLGCEGLAGGMQMKEGRDVARFFEECARRNPQGVARDYWLCALLLDKRLGKFAEELPKYYEVADSIKLPRYYAEALLLSNRLRKDTTLHCANPNVWANFQDFKDRERNILTPTARRNLLYNEYGTTYWWYYYYGEKNPG